VKFGKLSSCTQSSLRYCALTFSVPTRQFSAPANMYRRVELFRQLLARCRLEGHTYTDKTYKTLHIWTFDGQFLVIKIAIQPPFSI